MADDSKGMRDNKKAKPRVSRVVGELCLLIGLLSLLISQLLLFYDWGIRVVLIGAILAGLGLLLLRFNAKEREKKKRVLEGLVIPGVIAIAAGELWSSWPLVLGGLILAASPISTQIAESGRGVWRYLVKSYRDISRDVAPPSLK